MGRQRILLIAPLPPWEKLHREEPPLGLTYVAASLEANGHEVAIWDMGVSRKEVLLEIKSFEPSIVGIQVMTQHRFFVFDLAKKIKKELPEVVIVLGGPHSTFTADEILRDVRSVDIVVRGEGEMTMGEIADGVDLPDIPGISFREENAVIRNPSRPPLTSNELPMPAYHLLELDKYALILDGEPAMAILTSRGCPNKCIFCSASHMWAGMRFQEPRKVLATVKKLRDEFGYNAFIIEDDTFGANVKVAHEILEGLKRLGLKIAVKTRVNFLTKEFLTALKESNCVRVNFGVESGEPRILRVIKKNISLSQVIEVVKYCDELGIEANAYFMAGNIGETKEDVTKSIEFARKLRGYGANPLWAWGVFIFPGTEMESVCRGQGVLPSDFSWTKFHHNEKNLALGYSPYVHVYESSDLTIQDLVNFKREYLRSGKALIKSLAVKVIPWRLKRKLRRSRKLRKIYRRISI